MKKIIILSILLVVGIIDVKAITMDKNINYSGYYVSINDEVHELFYLKERRNNNLYFSLKYDENLVNYNYKESYGNYELVPEKLLQSINDAIYYGYQQGQYYDMNYFITQVLIFKFYYGYDNVHMTDEAGNIIYEDEINKIVSNFTYDKLIETNMELYQQLNWPDDRYNYDISSLDNTKIGEYFIYYYDDLDYTYYYHEDNFLFNVLSERVLHDYFKVYVNGLPVKFINKSNCKNFEVYQDGVLLTTFTADAPITNLNKRKSYVIKSGTAEISFDIDFYDTEELEIIFDKNDETVKENNDNDNNNNIEEQNPIKEEPEIIKKEDNIDEISSLKNEEKVADVINDDELPENPQTGDHIILFSIIFLSTMLIYLILYLKYLKFNKNS